MNSLIKTTIKRPVTVCILVIILLAVGVLATMDMSTNLLPNIALPMMGITVVYPGAGAQSVEDNVTSVLENALQTVPGITELETDSYDNVSVAILTFDYGTDLDKKIDLIEDTLKTAAFPDGCEEPHYVKIDMNGTATATIAMYNPNGDGEKLKQDANALATKLRAIEGVGSVDVLGVAERQIRIEALVGLDISSLVIVQSLQNENLDIPLGTVLQDGTVVSIRNASDATSVLQVMQLPATMNLGESALATFASLKNVVIRFATCTKQEFVDYVQKAMDAREVIEDIEGKTADELEEDQNSLSAVKSLMTLVRNNSSQQLKLMWHTIDVNLVQNQEFVNMGEDDLHALAEDMNMSYDVLKWLQDGANDGTLKDDWDKLVEFRAIFPYQDTNDDGEINGDDITYEQFACLFQDGDMFERETVDADGEVWTETVMYYGVDLLHSAETHEFCHVCDETCEENCDLICDRKTFTHEEATDVCEFAASVNTVAYDNIIQTKRDDGDDAEISDEQFAALFFNSTQGNDFAALSSPQVIHIIRLEHFNDGEGSVVDILSKSKDAHVDGEGNPVYKNGTTVAFNEDDKIVHIIGEKEYFVNNFGRIADEDGNLVDEDGALVTLSDAQKEYNYYNYGEYIIYTDSELLGLYSQLKQLSADTDLGITPTADTVRFVRICDFVENTSKLVVPLAYIGHVERYENEQSYAQYNGSNAVTVRVFATSDADTTKVVENVRATLAKENYQSVAKLLDDKAEFISDSISNVLSSIIIGGVLAVLVIYLFVRKVGSSLVVSITMPLSVLVALLGLWAMKITLNMVSLGGLAVGIGMLVDNSIVVLESITKRRDNGESVFDSCWHGTHEVAGSLLASTLTNICVFFPILFARGLTREIFYDLVWAVIYSIVMSLFVAITVIPSLYHLIYKNSNRPRYKKVDGKKVLVGSFEEQEPHSAERVLLDGTPAVELKPANATAEPIEDEAAEAVAPKALSKREKFKRWWNNPQGIHKMENAYGSLLAKLLTKRVLVCVVALAVFASSIAFVFTTGTEFLPSVDKGLIEVNMSFSGSADLDECKNAGQQAADLITEKYGENLQYVSLTVGKQGILETNISNVLRVQIDTNKLKTGKTAQEIRELLKNADIAANNISVSEVDGVVAEVTGGMSGQSVALLSDDMELLAVVAGKISEQLVGVEGIASVTDNTPQKTRQISFTFDKQECVNRGVDYQNAVLMLRVGLSGHTAANVTIDGEDCDVVVQFGEDTKNDLDSLQDIVVGFDSDGAVLLKDVLQSVTESMVVSHIRKQDGKYLTTIDVESYGADTGTISKRIAKVVNGVLAEYPNVTFEEGGVAAYLTDAFNGLVVSLIAAFLLLYGVMACQFESLLKPFIVIMSIPLGFTGGFLALAITGTTLNVVSFVGLIMLMGVIVNDAIVLVDKIDMLIAEGKTPQDAVLMGGKSRLRPILMTTLTTVLALIPLALGLGRGGTLMQPMGIVVIGGLTLGTMVTLILIPCFYCIIKRISFKKDKKPQTKEQLQEQQP